ncbi:MAG: HAMP domain-containing histidine kinase [Acidobacteria bacterium]|nr:HAMP domain-containing histidine kinase [Acidobacteriota bacterium]
MADRRTFWTRLALGFAVVVLGLLEIQGLVHTLRSQSRLRERVVRNLRESILLARGHLAATLEPGGPVAWRRAADEVLVGALASELELFDLSGRAVFSEPRPAPIGHWPGAGDLQLVRNGAVVTVGPIVQGEARLFTYLALRSGDATLVLRLATRAPDLLDDLRERRQILVGHGVALLVLLLAAAAVLFPSREEAAPPRALEAYEEAMERLRAHDAARTREHQAERRRMEDALEDLETMARAGELTAGIAHEVRNGLGTILGYAKLVEAAPSPAEAAEAAGRIREECQALETVVRRFLDFVKQERLSLSTFDPGRLFARIAARECRKPGAEVALDPSGAWGDLVGDEDLLERAFENLLRNAREAAGAGGHVTASARTTDETLLVAVTDDGPGLPPDSPASPQPFFTTKPGGLGLGLPLTLKIVRLHGGDLTFAPVSPHGLRVEVRLPCRGPARDVTCRNDAAPPESPSQRGGS